MPTGVWVVLGVVLVLLLWVAVLYNGLVRVRTACDESWSNIDTELKRRYDLIPNLVAAVKGYAAHEKAVLEGVTKARNAAMASHGSPSALARDENALIGVLRQLFVVAEAYPQLKANTNFLHLQQELSNTEDRIQRARRFYNGNVRDLNNRVQTFPSNVVAGLFRFSRKEFFEIDDLKVREVPAAKF